MLKKEIKQAFMDVFLYTNQNFIEEKDSGVIIKAFDMKNKNSKILYAFVYWLNKVLSANFDEKDIQYDHKRKVLEVYFSPKTVSEINDFADICCRRLSDYEQRESMIEISRLSYQEFIKEHKTIFGLSPNQIKSGQDLVLSILAGKGPVSEKKAAVSEYLSEELSNNAKFYSIRNDEKREIWMYKNGIYVPEGASYVQEFTRIILKENYSNIIYSLVIDKIIADNYIDEKSFFENNNTHLVPVKQGLLNIFTREIQPFSKEVIFFSKIEIEYDPSVDCPKIKHFFQDILGDDKDFPVMQEIFGYLLLRDYRFEKCFMFLGEGRNGKSKAAELMKIFIGAKNTTSLQPSIFEDPGNSMTSKLYGKLANISIDINSSQLKNTSMLKALSGRDLITADRKYKNPIEFVNYAKLIFGANELPITRDTKNAFWERWILLEFPYTFVSKEVYAAANKKEKKFLKIKNPDILEEITTEKEMQGLLNWALEGLHRLIENKNFSYKYTPKEVMSLWIRKSDSLNAFILDQCKIEYDRKIKKDDFYREYVRYCKKSKVKVFSKKMITVKLAEQGVTEEIDRTSDSYTPYYDGISFNDGRKEFIKKSLITEE
ncbi:MAG: phage/plasmid primase, P4 family [Eubacteriales bacterium]